MSIAAELIAVLNGQPLNGDELTSADAHAGYVLTADGAGAAAWEAPADGTGDVTGPATSTDNALARFSGESGNLLQDSAATLSDAGVLSVAGLKVGGAANYFEVESDGSLVLHGDATVWKDVDFPFVYRTGPQGLPNFDAVLAGDITAPTWGVNKYMVLEGRELPHEWKEGTTVYWHIHIITNGTDTTNRYLKFELQRVWATLDGQLQTPAPITTTDLLIPANTLDRTHLLLPIGVSVPIGAALGTHVYPRLKRLASTGAAPSADPFITLLQMHVECDGIGSRAMTSK